jgi:CRISPR-associated protein Cas1
MSNEIMVLNGHGIDIRVNSGHLKIKEGFPFKGTITEHFIGRGLNDIEHLVILGQTGSITFDAIKWMMDQNMIVSFLDPDGNIVTDFLPQNNVSAIVKRRQATATNAFRLKVSVWILSKKFSEQRNTLLHLWKNFKELNWWEPDREKRIEEALSISKDRENLLYSCLNIDSLRGLEAQVAAAYWQCIDGIPLSWSKAKNIPIHWLTIGSRTSPKTNSPRKAIDPFHAGMNYLYSVLETKIKTACIISGVDPDFGIIHADKPHRTSLVFDLMEPYRPKVDKLLLDWYMKATLNKKDFFETREGVCRLSPNIASQIVPLLKDLDSDITNTVKEFTGFFRNRLVMQKPEEFTTEAETEKPVKVKKKKPTLKQIEASFEERHLEQAKAEKIIEPKECLECGQVFVPTANGQRFCCKAHSNRYRQKKLRERRIAEGLCPVCGSDMPKAHPWGKRESLYCEKCTETRRESKRKSRDNKGHE